MKNLRELIKLKSDYNGDEIINYLKNKFKNIAEDIAVIQNDENDCKSLLVGLNTPLERVWPHNSCRAH